jgi:hypothetical protein
VSLKKERGQYGSIIIQGGRMAGEKLTRRQKDISRLIKERSKVQKDRIRRDKAKRRPGEIK